jgi:CMP/dCMP kinase
MIITLGGVPGAGKSTIKNLLATQLDLTAYSMGDMRGEMAKARGLTIDQLNDIGLHDPTTDNDIDAFQKKLGETHDNFIIDGAMSWYFIPQSYKIYLDVDPDVGAARIFADRHGNPLRSDEPAYTSIEETKSMLAARAQHNDLRYKKWYGASYLEMTNYDLVIDTTKLSTHEVLEKILNFIGKA